MDNDERRKMKQLMQEKGKEDEPLQWMYKQDKPDNEDFLLGKRIDKFEEEEEKREDSYGALFNERIQHNIQMDAQSKMREDPLFAIRHREEEAKRRLLDNPVKMKRLQQAIERQNKEKKEKKKRKDNDTDSDSDNDLMSAYLNIVNAKRKGDYSSDKSKNRRKREICPDGSSGSRYGIDRLVEDRGYSGDNGKRKGKYVDRGKHDSKIDRHRHRADDDRNYYSRKAGRDSKYRDSKSDGGDHERRYREDRSYRDEGKFYIGDTDRSGYSKRYDNRYSGRTSRDDRHNNRYSQSEINKSKKDYNDNKDMCKSDARSRGNDKLSHRNRAESSDSNPDKESKDQTEKGGNYVEHYKMGNRYRKDKYTSSASDSESDNERARKNTIERKNMKHKSSASDKEGNEIESKGKEKSEKILKKKRHDSSSSSSSSSSVKNSVASRHSNIRGSRQISSNEHWKRSDSSSSYDSKEESIEVRKKIADLGSDSEQEKRQKPKNYGLVILNPNSVPVKRSKKVGQYRLSSRSVSPPRKATEKKRSRSRTPPRQPKRKLTEEDKKRKLAEMMDNAKWREDQRSSNVKRYAKEEQLEQDIQRKNYETTGSSEFVNPMMSLHAENSSVADRIKRNKHNILRTTADMDRGFSKK